MDSRSIQDLIIYHSVVLDELTSLLSEYVSMEIDLEILDMLRLKHKPRLKDGQELDMSTTNIDNLFTESSTNLHPHTLKVSGFRL